MHRADVFEGVAVCARRFSPGPVRVQACTVDKNNACVAYASRLEMALSRPDDRVKRAIQLALSYVGEAGLFTGFYFSETIIAHIAPLPSQSMRSDGEMSARQLRMNPWPPFPA